MIDSKLPFLLADKQKGADEIYAKHSARQREFESSMRKLNESAQAANAELSAALEAHEQRYAKEIASSEAADRAAVNALNHVDNTEVVKSAQVKKQL